MVPKDLDSQRMVLCAGCRFELDARDLVGTWDFWHVIVNHSQNYLGKVFMMLRRHETDVTAMAQTEQSEFWQLLHGVKSALSALFAPDHFNYAFLMNKDPHVHLHIVPRYATSRSFADEEFVDDRFGQIFGSPERIMPVEFRVQLVEALRQKGLVAELSS